MRSRRRRLRWRDQSPSNDGGSSGWLLVCRQTVLKRADGTPDPSSWWSATDEALLLSDPSKPQFCSDLLREPNPRLCDPDDGKPMVRYKMIGWDSRSDRLIQVPELGEH